MSTVYPFSNISGVYAFSASTSSSNTAVQILPLSGTPPYQDYLIENQGEVVVYVILAASQALANAMTVPSVGVPGTGIPVLPGSSIILPGPYQAWFNAQSAVSTANLVVCGGIGNLSAFGTSSTNGGVPGGGTVTAVDVSGGTTGLTTSGGPVTNAGTITLAGTLALTNGGTGATTAAGARANLGLTASTGAGLIGTNDGWSTVQASLNARMQRVSLYSDLQAISPTNAALAPTASVMGRTSAPDGGMGVFDWITGDQSANVTADAQKGVWVPPSSDLTGASGAWKRRFFIVLNISWFGAKTDGGTELDGAITSGTANFTSALGTFTAADAGKSITIAGAGASGAGLTTTILAYVSATAVTLSANASTTVTAAIYNYGTDDATANAAALSYASSFGIKNVDFTGSYSLIKTALTVPAGVTCSNLNLLLGTPGMNGLRVNSNNVLGGTIYGTGNIGTAGAAFVERAVYPAVDAVKNVQFSPSLTAKNIVVGIQASPLVNGNPRPTGWTGTVYVENIVGFPGQSEGYGVLLSPANDCNLKIIGKTVQRHTMYFSAGASYNFIDVDTDGCQKNTVNFNTNPTLGDITHNTVRIKARNLTVPSFGTQGANQVMAFTMINNSHYNTIELDVDGGGTAELGFSLQGLNTDITQQPTGNRITGRVTGQFIGADVGQDLGCAANDYTNLKMDAYATVSVLALRLNGARAGANIPAMGPRIYDCNINAQGQSIRGIYDQVTDCPTVIENSPVVNNGAGITVDSATAGNMRSGRTKKATITGTTASIGASAAGATTVTIPYPISTTNRKVTVAITGSSVSGANLSTVTYEGNGAPTTTAASFTIWNGNASAQTFTYTCVVEGD